MTTWLPADVWRRVVERDASAAVAVLRVSRELHSVATSELRRLLPFDEVLALWRSSSTLCVQSQLCEALLLSPDAVAAHPHETRKRYGGGCYHVFDAREALPALVRASGGVRGLADRLGAHRSRLEAKRRRDEERPAAQADRAGRLGRGLAVLGLQRRADSEACSAYIRSGNDLERALRTAAHMHFLHEHTDGAYAAAVDDGVEEEARDRGFHYPGIYRETTLLVQRRPPFRLPAALPWLLDFACTATALDAADGVARCEAGDAFEDGQEEDASGHGRAAGGEAGGHRGDEGNVPLPGHVGGGGAQGGGGVPVVAEGEGAQRASCGEAAQGRHPPPRRRGERGGCARGGDARRSGRDARRHDHTSVHVRRRRG